MHFSKIIRDPLHGDVGLSDLEVRLLDSPQMQRLRRIKQNGLCFLAYPAMNSTRFEHCLGVMHLAGLLCDYLETSAEDMAHVRAAGLLHDVGHTPFSHSSESVLKAYGIHHEQLSQDIVRESVVGDMLGEAGLDAGRVAGLICGEGEYGKIISSEIDVDKMDYLIRDAYYAGVAYGVTDIERIIQRISYEGDELTVRKGGLEAVESLLVNRNLMYQTVYRHHTKRIAESMFTHALQTLIEEGVQAPEICGLDDYGLVSLMRSQKGYVSEMMACIDERRLYKNIFQDKISLIPGDLADELSTDTRRLEKEIIIGEGLEAGDLIFDYPEVRMSEFKIKVDDSGVLRPIDEVSPLARSLEESEGEKLFFNVYARPEKAGKLELLPLRSYLGLG